MIEIWKDVVGYESLYKVSNLGNVLSLNYNHTGKPRLLKKYDRGNGYYFVALVKNGVTTKYNIHCLVAKAFIPNPYNLPCVNHKDEIRTNNCVDNLEWCTYKYNSNYGTAIEKRVKKQSKKVAVYTKDGQLLKIYESATGAEKDGYKEAAISMVCNGKRKTHHNLIFKYVD